MPDMQHPEWGLAPEAAAPKLYWGGRAIITYSRYSGERGLDIPRDRQCFMAENDNNQNEFMEWLNDRAIPYLIKCVKNRDTGRIVCANRSGNFHCVAEDRNSGGYLYIGAWED